MSKEFSIDVVENHCWKGSINSEAYQVLLKARKEGKKTIPFKDLRPKGEMALSIEELLADDNDLDIYSSEIVHISALEFDGQDEVSYTIKVKFPD